MSGKNSVKSVSATPAVHSGGVPVALHRKAPGPGGQLVVRSSKTGASEGRLAFKATETVPSWHQRSAARDP